MITTSSSQFKDKKVLLLQGPIGPFFRRLASDLRVAGASVFKINFNGGDLLFYPLNAINFKQSINEWPVYFEEFIVQNKIDKVLLFGDCRPIHKIAHEIASKYHIEIGVFEEGYIRPDYITLEKYGVNGHSTIPKFKDFYEGFPESDKHRPYKVGNTFWYAAMWGMMYNTATVLASLFFKHDCHHRILSIWQGLYWIRSLWRKWLYAVNQRDVLQKLITEHDKKYYLVPLQVHNDAQIHHHSDFFNIDAFISEVINSFGMYAPVDCHLVIKHHPMDRGFNHYGKLIDTICQNKALKHRVHYVHDLHLPTLLDHSKGVVVVNSTVGLSALIHNCPVIACGNAIYDINTLTYQGALDDFWESAASFKLNQKLLNKFINYVIKNSQINGNFYKTLDESSWRSGVSWPISKRHEVSNVEYELSID